MVANIVSVWCIRSDVVANIVSVRCIRSDVVANIVSVLGLTWWLTL